MDEYADIYYVDDNRNAVITHDHRTGSSGSGSSAGRSPWPFPRPAVPVQPARTVYIGSSQPQPRPAVSMQPQVMYPPPGYPMPGYPMGYPPPQSAAATLFGKLTTGQVVEMVAQIFAALQSLPAAPIATKEAATDVGNLILFQNALAQHAKRDEQVRTLGSLVAKLVG
jgi:hypothetical protein